MQSQSKIIGFGAYVPERILTNNDLESMVETNDEWIIQRTGIKERRIAREDELASDMAIKAIEDLVDKTGTSLEDVDQIIVTTFTPDCFTPTVSALVQAHFGMEDTGTFDLNSGCTGFAYGLSVADALISSGQCKKVLVVASENISRTVDYTDRTTCILFGDGSAACMLEHTDGPGAFLGRYFHTDGNLGVNLTCTNYADSVLGTTIEKKGVIEQNGQQVYRYVMQNVPGGIRKLLESTGISTEELDLFVPHSANMRIIQGLCERLAIPSEKTLSSIELYGNTSSATIPLCLWSAQNNGQLQSGKTAMLYGFGGGLTHGGVIVRF